MLKNINLASVSVIASYLFAKLIEKRSYQKLLYEIMIRATKMKQPFEKKINAKGACVCKSTNARRVCRHGL